MPQLKLSTMVRILATVSAFSLICPLNTIAALAQTASVGGSGGSGDNGGNIGASLGRGALNGGTTANGPESSASSASFGFGRGTGSSTGSSLGFGDARTNFTSAFSRNGSTGALSAGNGEPTAALGFGNAGLLPSAGVQPASPAGIAAAISSLTPQEQRMLARKCISVLAAPQNHGSDTVSVCKVLASL